MTYKFRGFMDAEHQLLKLVIVDADTGVEHEEYGEVIISLADILTLVTNSMTPVNGTIGECRTVKLRETSVCMDDGSTAFALFLRGDYYTK